MARIILSLSVKVFSFRKDFLMKKLSLIIALLATSALFPVRSETLIENSSLEQEKVITNTSTYEIEFSFEEKDREPLRGKMFASAWKNETLRITNTRGYVKEIFQSDEKPHFLGLIPGAHNNTIVPGYITTGNQISFLVKPHDDGSISVDYVVKSSHLTGKHYGFDEITVDENTIQIPSVESTVLNGTNTITNGNWTTLKLDNKYFDNKVLVKVTKIDDI